MMGLFWGSQGTGTMFPRVMKRHLPKDPLNPSHDPSTKPPAGPVAAVEAHHSLWAGMGGSLQAELPDPGRQGCCPCLRGGCGKA